MFNLAGSYTLGASDGGLAPATSAGFSVSAAAASQLVIAQGPSDVVAGVAESPSITVWAEDQFGNLAIADTSSVTLAVATGPGSASGTLTSAVVNDVATFSNVILTAAGAYTLRANDGSLTGGTTNGFAVNPAAASQLAYAQQPTDAVAGVAVNPSIGVAVEDAFGNVVTTDTSSVALAIGAGPGAAGGTLIATAANGVATFGNVTFQAAGGYVLTASDGSLATASSNSFNISPAAAAKLVFGQEPGDGVAGTAENPAITVSVEDQFGNLVTSDSSTVAVAVNAGPGSAGGTLSAAAVNGVAAFGSLSFTAAGSYTLAASDGSLTSAVSTSFSIAPAAATQLAYTRQPGDGVAGIAVSPSIAVAIEDQFGNTVTTDTSTVMLAVDSGQGAAGGTLTATAVNGVASFNNAIFDTSGVYSLAATDGALTAATSSSFTVSAAAAAQLSYVQEPSDVVAGTADSLAISVNVEDQFGNIVSTDQSSVTLAVAGGPGAASGTLTATAVNGVATFGDVEFNASGSYTLAATDGNLVSAASNSFAVSPAAAARVVFATQPGDMVAGAIGSPAIVAQIDDQFGNLVSTDSSLVTLVVNSGPGAAGGTLSVAAVNGVATFNDLTLETAGDYTLAANDGSLIPGTSNTFVVTPGAATKLVFTGQPTDAVAGVALNPPITVAVEDQFGNVVTGDQSAVTLAVASGPGTPSGALTISAVNGVATFSDARFNTAGSYTLSASDGGLAAATSVVFAVHSAAAAQLVYAQQPSDGSAGAALSPPVVVYVEDQFGNVVTNDGSTVSLSVATGPGSASGGLAVGATNGVATFNDVRLTTAGNYTLAARDDGLTAATSIGFAIMPAAPAKLAFSRQPSTVDAGIAQDPGIVVVVEDSFGNVVTSDTSAVTLSVATGPGAASGRLSAAAVNGVATFGDFILNTAGDYTLAADDTGLTSATSAAFTVAPDATSITLSSSDNPSVFGQTVTYTATVTNIHSSAGVPTGVVAFLDGSTNLGMAALDGSGVTVFHISAAAVGAHAITAVYAGETDYLGSSSSALTQNVGRDATTTTIASSSAPSVYGQAVVFTATVTADAPGAGLPQGSVTFKNGSAILGTSALNGSGIATFTALGLNIGDNSIAAVYGGDTNNFSSTSAAMTQTVDQDGTTPTVTSSEQPSVFGQAVTFSTTVAANSPGSGTPTGSVAFLDGATVLGSAFLDSSGIATFTTDAMAVGSHAIVAVYAGDTRFSGSTSAALTQGVQKDATTTQVSSSEAPSVFGESVTFTAAVSIDLPGVGVPSGTVTFKDGTTILGTASLDSSGVATFETSDLSVADHSITAVYGGDGNDFASNGSAFRQTVNQDSTTTSVTSSSMPAVFGQTVTFTAAESADAPGANIPTGAVAFMDGTSLLGTVTLDGSGIARFGASGLGVAGHSITAVYGGDTNDLPSNSSALNRAVNRAGTTSAVTASPNSSIFGQLLTLTATVATSAPGSGAPTGDVTFFDGQVEIGVATLDSAANATFSTSALAVVDHAITVTYDGDTNDASSNSAAGALAETIVDSVPTVTSLAASSPASPIATTSTGLSVLGSDGDGESALVYDWTTTGAPPAAVAFSVNNSNAAKQTVVTFAAAGTYTFQVTITNDVALSTTSSVMVTVDQTLSSLTVTPALAALNENGTQQFSASAYDQFSQLMAPQPPFAWTSSGVGSTDASGLYTAPYGTGSATVTATSGSIFGAAAVTVSDAAPSVAASASASPSPADGTTAALSVLGDDDGGEPNLTYTWTTVGAPPAPVQFSGNADNSAKSTTATFAAAGNYDFEVTITDAAGVSVTSDVSLTVGQTLTAITVTPTQVSFDQNEQQQFAATGYDQFGAIMANPAVFQWSVYSGVGAINSNGLYSAGASDGMAWVTASDGVVSGFASLAVNNAAPTVVTAAAAAPGPITGATTTLSVLGADDDGEPNLYYDWQTVGTPLASVIFSDNQTNSAQHTVATFSRAGDYQFRVTVMDAGGMTVASDVSVTVDQTLTAIAVSPATEALNENQSQQLAATGYDQFGDALSSPPNFAWSVVAGVGSVDSAGLCTAPGVSGSATVQASSGSILASATISATNATPTVAAPAATAGANPITSTSTTLSATGADDGGAADLRYTWTVGGSSAPVTFSENDDNAAKATRVTFAQAGTYTFTVTITDAEGLAATSSVTVAVEAILTVITVSPADAAVRAGSAQQFTASGFDQFGASFVPPLGFGWSQSSGVGSIDSSGLYAAGKVDGSAAIRATSGDVAATTGLSVIGGATRLVIVVPPAGTLTGQTLAPIQVALEDADGNVVTSDQSLVAVSSDTALAGTVAVAAVNGIATFNDLAIGVAGLHTLTFSEGTLAAATSDSFAVTAPTTTILPTIAGKPAAPIVIDAGTSFPQTGGKTPRKLSIQVASDTSSGTAILRKRVGVHGGKAVIRDLKIHQAGVYTLTLSDAQGHAITRQFTVLPAAPAKLMFTGQPAHLDGSDNISVAVEDRYGNIIESDDSTLITLRLAPHSNFGLLPQLTGSVTMAAAHGVATFTGISITRAGMGRLSATASRLRVAISAPFRVA